MTSAPVMICQRQLDFGVALGAALDAGPGAAVFRPPTARFDDLGRQIDSLLG